MCNVLSGIKKVIKSCTLLICRTETEGTVFIRHLEGSMIMYKNNL